MPEHSTRSPVPALTTFPVKVDLKALQKALVFTRMAYNNVTGGGSPMPSVPVRRSKSAASNPASPTHHVDAFGDTDEKHLPWSFD